MQIGCNLKTIRFHKIRCNLLCWFLGSARIAGKQGYLPSGLHGYTCLECRMGREWCTRSAHRHIHLRYIWDFSLSNFIRSLIKNIFVVFSMNRKNICLCLSTWFWFRTESSIDTLWDTSSSKTWFDFPQLFNHLHPYLSCLVWCLVTESQLRDIDNLLSVEG